MDKYYLEFLNELGLYLNKDNNDMWANWMKKAEELFKENRDLTYFFSAFGGSGSFNDYFSDNNSIKSMIDVLKNISYTIASMIQNNLTGDIEEILFNEEQRYLSNIKNGFNSETILEELKYLRYLIENYKYLNLNDINMKYEQQNSKNGVKRIN